MTLSDICNWLNDQSGKRPALIDAMLRTQFVVDDLTEPKDLFVYSTSGQVFTTDIIAMLNSMFQHTGQQITTVNIDDTFQFIAVNINEKV